MTGPVREIYHGMRAKRWLATAVVVEALGLVGAIGSIPALGFLPLIWALSIVGILSTVGVVIVTAHYVWEYNRRPLNATQEKEIRDLLSPYLPSVEAQKLAPMSELANYVPEPELFWVWRYQQSVLELAWTALESLRQPGFVLVAELTGSSFAKKVQFTLLPPPMEVLGECLSTLGDETPRTLNEWGTLFIEFDSPIVFFQSGDGKIKYLRPGHRVVFDDNLAAPIPVPFTRENRLPELRKTPREVSSPVRDWGFEWVWETPQSN